METDNEAGCIGSNSRFESEITLWDYRFKYNGMILTAMLMKHDKRLTPTDKIKSLQKVMKDRERCV